jgi:hypothetical protein
MFLANFEDLSIQTGIQYDHDEWIDIQVFIMIQFRLIRVIIQRRISKMSKQSTAGML